MSHPTATPRSRSAGGTYKGHSTVVATANDPRTVSCSQCSPTRLERFSHFRVFLVPLEIDEEDIFRLGRPRRERLDPGQVQLVLLEQVQRIDQRTRIVRQAEHDRRLVVPRLARLLMADEREACLVVLRVVDLRE